MNMRVGTQDMSGFMVPQNQYYADAFGGYGSGMNLLTENPVRTPLAIHGNALSQFGNQDLGGGYDFLDPKNIFGKDGWGGLALGAGQGLFNGYLGLQQLGMAKKAFGENQRQFNLNYDAQRRTTNAALEDRQRARLASNAGAYQSVGDYMNQYGVK